MNPFDFVKSINKHSKHLMRDKQGDIDKVAQKSFDSFLVNRAFSMFSDTVYYADMMNNQFLEKEMIYDFYYYIIRPKSRWKEWPKKFTNDHFKIIQDYYKCNNNKTLEYLELLNEEQINILKQKMIKGGINKK